MSTSPSTRPSGGFPGLDLGQLEAYLRRSGRSLDNSPAPFRFSAGFGNMNFFLSVDGRPCVLRRPPLGTLPPGANDMAREFRILHNLHPVFPLVPEAYLFCEDRDVLGAPFFLMEYRPGLVIGSEIASDTEALWSGEVRLGAHLGTRLIEVLSNLHRVDVVSCGLGELGRTEGFLDRTVRGWDKRARLSWTETLPQDLMTLLDWLAAHSPEEASGVALIHNDFKLDNIILDPATFEPLTLIDWDMGTLGDPLYDLAVLLSYWTEAGDPEVMHTLRQMPTDCHGFPNREAAAAHYAKLSGRDLRNFEFYRVLATLRLAVVFRQLFRRYETGATHEPAFAAFDTLSAGLLRFGVQIARGEYY